MRPSSAGGATVLGVTGTDTGVGKTAVTCGLLYALRARGVRVAGMKPVETGVSARGAAGTDAAAIARAAGVGEGAEDVCPVVFAEPLAPMVAAERAGTVMELSVLDEAFGRLKTGADVVVVEGAGGLLVPVREEMSFGELFARWGADVVVVAANRLGVLNHARLTVEAAERRGLRVRAVVLNEVEEGGTGDVARATNEAVLRGLMPGIPVVGFPWVRGGGAGDERVLREAGEKVLRAMEG